MAAHPAALEPVRRFAIERLAAAADRTHER